MLTPFNFHDRDPSRTRVSGVKLQLESEFSLGAKPRYYGGRFVEDVGLKVVSLRSFYYSSVLSGLIASREKLITFVGGFGT
jgi:primary-amine oxidase